MKRMIIALAATFFCSSVFSQDFTGLKDYKFSSKEDYKAKEPQVKECAQYVFAKPYDPNDVNRLIAEQYLIAWMSGTPDYGFTLGKGYAFVTDKKSDPQITALYMAGMVLFVFDNPDKSKDVAATEKATIVKLVDYCADANNKVKPSKELKKLIEAKQQGKLEEAIQY